MPDTCDALNKENVRKKILGGKKNVTYLSDNKLETPQPSSASMAYPIWYGLPFRMTLGINDSDSVPLSSTWSSCSWLCLWLNLVLILARLAISVAHRAATYAASVGVFIRKSVCLTVACTCGLANVAAFV